ncbi:DEAD/DEAH box helicase [Dyadobacter chenwenxiniae]|uniref:DEAD-box ATP-dependent RNA helicase RhpA n=1 Tax=Dyadobacter chenwenxiniae TaxID=2906456 RepID=A0A9X1PJA1_9BACT|nr:DEAD/DEAH box helicase [Dyadobacter chenwenxiniae]MCF0048725.1 DEAD/DEAH box helicase [Dyadobacter chenwenxiniae]MCF0062437.1 DEAD/DEAH box helicase [Dyadobacter chenwenxiniae]UON83813.1 DEAD/DEAH box helicase [Dyadobacter chenwenxiniae]
MTTENFETFEELGLSENILKALTEMGFTKPSPIQAQGIPAVMQGSDVIGQAQTGTGKTAAFGIPVLERIDVSSNAVQALVLCPTRELAVQVSEEIGRLAKYIKGLRIEAIYGGDSIDRQIRSLKKGVHIVVGTPGRVMDHMERKTLKFDEVRMMVLDEADEMLDMGFREDIESILADMPSDRQTILFSATMSKPIMSITKRFQTDPILIKVVRNELTNVNIEQVYFEVKPQAKVEVMTRLIDMHHLKSLLVFCNTKRKVDEIVEDLQLRGYASEGIHGDLRQQQRSNVMSKFKAGVTTILVATDVAARGIDVSGLDGVINFDIPLDEEYYVHRIGRTGRAGLSGKAFSLVARDEKYRLKTIESFTKVKIEKGVIPSYEDIVGVRKARFVESISATIQEGDDQELFGDVLEMLQHAGYSTEQVVGAMAKQIMGVQKNEYADANLAWEERRGERDGRREGGSDRFERRPSSGGRFGDRRESAPRGNDRYAPAARGESRPRSEGSRDESKRSATPEAGMTRLFLSLGRKDHILPKDIVGAIAGEANIPGKTIGAIDIYDKFTFVDVPERDARAVLRAMDGNTIKGKPVQIDIAK